jgi:tripartite ATP-independent transporter DctM subunit
VDWPQVLLLLFGLLALLLATGIPVFVAFLTINLVGFFVLMGPAATPTVLTLSIYDSLTRFALAPVPLFILMGELMFRTGIAFRTIDAINQWLGKLPGRLSLVAIGAGTLYSSLTGSAMGSTAMLGSALLPEMRRRGYSKEMSIGPIVGGGSLAIMIPPSALAVLLGSIAQIPIGALLIASIPAGLLLAVLFAAYSVGRCWLQPHLAPPYEPDRTPLGMRVATLARDVAPMGFIIFVVIGFIILGIATPTESAALGAAGTAILAVYYRSLSWTALKQALVGTTSITAMSFMILAGSTGYSQILAFSGATAGMVDAALHLDVPPLVLLALMQFGLIVLGLFVDEVSMILLTAPLYMPIVHAMGWDPVWFGIITLINLEIGLTSPPFGLVNFVMKGVAPPDVSMTDIWWAGLPYMLLGLLAMGLIMLFPGLVTWLPALMK